METVNDTLIEVVKALGGSKVVGLKLWPELLVDQAQRKLLDCLNTERPARLDPEQVAFLFRLEREAGLSTGFNAFCRMNGYEATKAFIVEDEKARLQREFIEAQKSMQAMLERMERLT